MYQDLENHFDLVLTRLEHLREVARIHLVVKNDLEAR